MQYAVQASTDIQDVETQRFSFRRQWTGQFIRFGTVGGLNTLLDLLILNGLLKFFPTTNIFTILMFNSIAYSVGAINSFLLNKYWTFGQRQKTTWREVSRFMMMTMLGIVCNDALFSCANILLRPLIVHSSLWVNASKGIAISGTVLISYFGMRLWVFVRRPQVRIALQNEEGTGYTMSGQIYEGFATSKLSLSIVLPAFNEEQVIAHTISDVLDVVPMWMKDFEVIVVDDGSKDQTASIVTAFSERDAHVRLVQHEVNQGYGAALVSGFAAATKEYTFFMDSDGQFNIRDLGPFFLFLSTYDAVIGYRIERQDTWIRKLNAWGWKQAVRVMLGVQVRDLDCAFKLLPTEFLHMHPLQTRGAMINAELMYRLKMAGCTYKEVGVRHLPRRAGRATGANPAVIIRAFRELFIAARTWKQPVGIDTAYKQTKQNVRV